MAQVRVGVGCFVLKKVAGTTYFLLGHRKGSHGSGTWGLPGGHLEVGEEWAECAARETLEECGIEVGSVQHVATTNDVFSSEMHYITVFQKAAIKEDGGLVRRMEPEKCLDWIWVTWQELSEQTAVDLRNRLFLPLANLKKLYAGSAPAWLQ
ncbi:hypothetical protein GQ54DRAFT_264952 [Martensiomyces pterosporus]|nr:hypothetical protein GQ54DRAFT_264952 [Martensiomyces pterosporus]